MNETLVRTNGHTREAGEGRSNVWFTPRFDVYETQNDYVLQGDLPGVSPENLELTFENGELSIHGRVQPRYDRCVASQVNTAWAIFAGPSRWVKSLMASRSRRS